MNAPTSPCSVRRSRRTGMRRARRAFTLLEVIVAVMIVALLATLVAPRLMSNIGRSKQRIAKAEAASLAQQVNLYLLDNDMTRPHDDFDLTALVSGDDPYLQNASDLIDPWDNEYIILVPGEHNIDFDIISYGADGQPGGTGEDADVVNE